MQMDLAATPILAPGCRIHTTQPVLLIPEGTLQLSGPSHAILSLVDGRRAVTEIVDSLMQQFEGAPRSEIETDVLDLLNRLQERGVVRT